MIGSIRPGPASGNFYRKLPLVLHRHPKADVAVGSLIFQNDGQLCNATAVIGRAKNGRGRAAAY
jgi:hypothetical protein